MSKNIWLLRWVFDPVHEGHHANMVASISAMQLKELDIIVKFLWEKDPAASLNQRKEMLRLQFSNSENVEIITQNISWHIAHILELWTIYEQDELIHICWSDKINEEMEKYWKNWYKFWVVIRKEFKIDSQSLEIAQKIWIVLESITPNLSTSSSFIRSELLKNRDKKPEWLNESVYNFILENDLYVLNRWIFSEYVKYWNWFIEFSHSNFPELELFKLDIPDFNQLQHIDWWKEKFIRYVVNKKWLKWNELEEFVKNALQYKY